MTKAEALKLRGRMQFADSQIFGRAGKLCLKAVSDHAYKARTKNLNDEAKRSLERLWITSRKPSPGNSQKQPGRPGIFIRMLAMNPSRAAGLAVSGASWWTLSEGFVSSSPLDCL